MKTVAFLGSKCVALSHFASSSMVVCGSATLRLLALLGYSAGKSRTLTEGAFVISSTLSFSICTRTISHVLLIALLPCVASGQSVKEYSIPRDKLECLLENSDRYLDQPRAAFAFTPAACPRVGNEDISSTSMNTGEETEGAKRIFILRNDFKCLISQIKGYIAEHGNDVSNEGVVSFTLDCPQ